MTDDMNHGTGPGQHAGRSDGAGAGGRRHRHRHGLIVDVLIPALNEEEALPLVLRALPRDLVRQVYVIDNGSSDATGRVAVQGGAQLLFEEQQGYGAACLRGVRELTAQPRPPDVAVFIDGDFSDDPAELPWLLEPLYAGTADLVIGSRTLGEAEPGSLSIQQRVGNRVAVSLIRGIYGQRYTDLGPFRAVRLPALVAMGMSDTGNGWNVEMQVKAARVGLRVAEVPVSYRRRVAGRSKISATVKGTVGATYKMLFTIFRHATAR
jgi:glycosyltransferase involved in cell wall biosynthesis